MREDGGFELIKKAILNLLLRHKEHISAYGEGNESMKLPISTCSPGSSWLQAVAENDSLGQSEKAQTKKGGWEFQVGPSVGIEAGDHVWCARYILERITEQAGVVLTLDPKPIEGDWNGAGCHTNYSTKSMREDGGFELIKVAILNLLLHHKEHICAYGEGNESMKLPISTRSPG
ncbi:hypothetical protein RHSIM_Rhsim04G0209200 [Rhododendron simsii]|uniref:glutamine synthetase n=1 Tax=Rhododendron simsii TaxID=118357 RepID=A0A834LU22_RHOSS|nr:hypothetical protein RHSIM_Rhsim04G0209200 [Rhododendron simsii]